MSRARVQLRAVVLWSLANGAVMACLVAAAPELAALGAALRSSAPVADAPFERQLVWLAAVVLVAGTTWLWAVLTVVVARVVVTPGTAPRRPVGVPRSLHRWVLTGCGLALAGGLLAPAHAGTASPDLAGTGDRPAASTLLEGLPLPERATAPTGAAAPSGRYVVRPGDSLWRIAASRLPADATDAEVAASSRALHQLNRAVIGADPDVIRPTQRLRLPGA